MRLSKIAATLPAIALLVSPVVASASSAQKLSVAQSAPVRASAAVDEENNLAGGAIVGVLAAAAVIAGIIIIADGDDEPTSP